MTDENAGRYNIFSQNEHLMVREKQVFNTSLILSSLFSFFPV